MFAWWCSLLLFLHAAAWPYSTYRSSNSQPPQLRINKTGPVDPGLVFLSPSGRVRPAGLAPLIYDDDGNLVYEGLRGNVGNFRVQQLNGIDVITFWTGNMTAPGIGFGSVHILDMTYTEIYTVSLTGPFVTPDNLIHDSYIDIHESLITPQNTILVTAYNATPYNLISIGGSAKAWVLDSQFYEIDLRTNQILTEWSALEDGNIPLSSSHQILGPFDGTRKNPYDAYHINAIEMAKYGFFVSLRHTWSGYYLFPNGSVRWCVNGKDGGDFTRVGDTNFSWQHDMRLHNETDHTLVVSLLNNANTPTDHQSFTTGMELAIDLTKGTVTGNRSLSDPNDGICSISQGSYQILNETDGHVFIDYGSIAKVKEFDGNGTVVYSAQFGEDNAVASYRGYRCPWRAIPFWKPSVMVIRTGTKVTVFMSWNGATDYDNWILYLGTSQTSVEKDEIGMVMRTGFETAVTLTKPPTRFIQVVARRGELVLSTSETVFFLRSERELEIGISVQHLHTFFSAGV
ncbi:hypothetical protein N7492_005694 [Penicillium capsulatum]|uniref:ASST-domain-containing protein n=1 Tax=Penicillium capsulatum TaxID=69766 RepID=A0A9W9ICX1_9EURO|nr:hypothetical protein N7492_005694 [Penicillium capsulatum]KAJ6135208.1 hypothetical protein N7512_000368 [Penicillium capsulatum]